MAVGATGVAVAVESMEENMGTEEMAAAKGKEYMAKAPRGKVIRAEKKAHLELLEQGTMEPGWDWAATAVAETVTLTAEVQETEEVAKGTAEVATMVEALRGVEEALMETVLLSRGEQVMLRLTVKLVELMAGVAMTMAEAVMGEAKMVAAMTKVQRDMSVAAMEVAEPV